MVGEADTFILHSEFCILHSAFDKVRIMIKRIKPAPLAGTITAIASKSMAHRLMICAGLAEEQTNITCATTSKDMEATKACLHGLFTDGRLPCGESGTTLRLMLPLAAALGKTVEFHMEGRLPQRPMAPLDEQLCAHGARLSRPREDILRCEGKLTPGDYTLPGNVSSQYISGLLLALPLLNGPSTLTVTGKVESEPYIHMTLAAMEKFGISVKKEENVYFIPSCRYKSPGSVTVEGDWSNAAFWLCAGSLGKAVSVTGLDRNSLQGDKKIMDILQKFGAKVAWCGETLTVSPGKLTACDIDAAEIPDLVPVLAVVASAAEGTTRIYNARRLRLKESDRLETVTQMLTALGGKVEQTEDGLLITGAPLLGGTVDSVNDHRIAMAAAVASILCKEEVTVLDAQAVEKSYPQFWEDFERLQREAV